MTREEAIDQLTSAGAPFELLDAEIGGQSFKVYRNAPASLKTVFDSARLRGDGIFLVYEDERWTFADAMRQVDAFAALLVERYDVRPGDRVAIAMRNYPEWIFAFAAITSIGAIAVALNGWWTTEELAFGLSDSGSRVVIADRERMERIVPALPRFPDLRILVVRFDGEPVASVDRLQDILAPGRPMPPVDVQPGHDAMILYTSGTTGHPNGAVSTHLAVTTSLMSFACRATVRKLLHPDEQEQHPFPPCMILVVPLFHVTGLVPVMMSCFASGTRLVIMYKWNAERALELIERERVTTFVGVPTMSFDLLESPEFTLRDTSSLLSVGGGGAPAPPELVRRIDKAFSRGNPGIGYGMTETNAYGPQNQAEDYLRKPTSTGWVVPSMELRVTGADDLPLPQGEVGEIWFRGANLIRGYWNRAEATAETIIDGWLRSGDIGRIDEEGFVYVQDRAKDMVLRAGENVYCAEVEAAIYEHPAVHEAAVFGLPHERLGEEVGVAILPKRGHHIDGEMLREFLSGQIAPFKIPSRVEIAQAPLPRNASGKILKREIRDALAAGQPLPTN